MWHSWAEPHPDHKFKKMQTNIDFFKNTISFKKSAAIYFLDVLNIKLRGESVSSSYKNILAHGNNITFFFLIKINLQYEYFVKMTLWHGAW